MQSSAKSPSLIEYRNGDLFSAEALNVILVHACNCQGVWGSGIAVTFKQRYPEAHKAYQHMCKNKGDRLLGTSTVYLPQVWQPRQQKVGCLFTSEDYGQRKDGAGKILRNTETALRQLLDEVNPVYELHSPKINSGKFDVPWKDTAAILETVLAANHKAGRRFKWVVWDNARRH